MGQVLGAWSPTHTFSPAVPSAHSQDDCFATCCPTLAQRLLLLLPLACSWPWSYPYLWPVLQFTGQWPCVPVHVCTYPLDSPMPKREQDTRENGAYLHWLKERTWKKNKSYVLPCILSKGPNAFSLFWVSHVMQPALVKTLVKTLTLCSETVRSSAQWGPLPHARN